MDDEKRLQACTTHEDITVSKLSALQKRILLYAHQRMAEQGQTLPVDDDPLKMIVCLDAPDWLQDALIAGLKKIFKARKIGQRDDHILDGHPWLEFFLEIATVEADIAKAAETHEIKRRPFTRLFEYALEAQDFLKWTLLLKAKVTYPPWPDYDGRFFFKLEIEAENEAVAERIRSEAGSSDTAWISAGKSYRINCTLPEMLRDLYGFPVTQNRYTDINGNEWVSNNIDALAFSPREIGEERYNRAQAALRRACSRLEKRKLIVTRGRTRGWWGSGVYVRTGIGLTEQGVAVASQLGNQNVVAEAA